MYCFAVIDNSLGAGNSVRVFMEAILKAERNNFFKICNFWRLASHSAKTIFARIFENRSVAKKKVVTEVAKLCSDLSRILRLAVSHTQFSINKILL